MIGNCDGALLEGGDTFDEIFDLDGSVEERELCVDVEVNELGHRSAAIFTN